MATYSSILAWRIPWTEKPGGLLTVHRVAKSWTRLKQFSRQAGISVVSDSLQPVDCSPPSSSAHGILQARILEWVAISFSRGSSRPRDRTQVSHIAGRHFNLCTTRVFCFFFLNSKD